MQKNVTCGILQMFLVPASQLKTISVLSIIFEDFRFDLRLKPRCVGKGSALFIPMELPSL